MNNNLREFINQNKGSIVLSVTTTLFTAVTTLFGFVFWFQDAKMEGYINSIEQNRINISDNQEKLNKLIKDIEISNEKFEKQMQRYIDNNYGELSRRDEDVSKLIYLYKQQEKRLSNIEKALME